MTVRIYSWNQLSGMQWDALLLGNGASAALHTGFNYASLYQLAHSRGTLRSTTPIFSYLGTTDFEHVLLACWHAYLVNSALATPNHNIEQAYNDVRNALIDAVHQIHPTPGHVASSMPSVGSFASQFATVVTVNYDITFYWAMQEFNNRNGQWFKDSFIRGFFDPDWQGYRQPYGTAKGATLVFYAHGSLALARDRYGVETKLTASSLAPGGQSPLLNTITDRWMAGSHVPLFVSEGTSEAKITSIRRSAYLSTVYDHVLPALGGAAVVYGLDFSENDRHLLKALNLRGTPPGLLAVSVFGALSPTEQEAFCLRVKSVITHHLPNTDVVFYDSSSRGCWNNP